MKVLNSFTSKIVRIFASLALSVLMIPVLSAAAPSQAFAEPYADSGCASVGKTSASQLHQQYLELQQLKAAAYNGSAFSVEPNVSAYTAGTLTPAALDYTQTYINYVRAVAGLGPIAFTSQLNDNAAQGALILARIDDQIYPLTHTPGTPSGITDAQAAAGKSACASSNISWASAGYADPLGTAIQGQMDDNRGGNINSLGHRRWLINPATSTMGIGYAVSPTGGHFTNIRVFGDSTEYGIVESNNPTDYDFIAWPASGYMPTEVFSSQNPWSVTLNPSKFNAPSSSNVRVTVTRESDGTSWTLDSDDYFEATSDSTCAGPYFNVSNSYQGVNNCIMFTPGFSALGTLRGTYTVSISGLTNKSGQAEILQYQVNFFKAASSSSPEGPTVSNRKDLLNLNGIDANFKDGTYPWAIEGNSLASSNAGIDSSSSVTTIALNSNSPFTISFNWGVSSESGYDKLSITLDEGTSNASTLVSGKSGEDSGSVKDVKLSAGNHTLTLNYTKDNIVSDGEDYAWISDFAAKSESNVHVHSYGEPIATINSAGIISVEWVCKEDASHIFSDSRHVNPQSIVPSTCIQNGTDLYETTFGPYPNEGIAKYTASFSIPTAKGWHAYSSLNICAVCSHVRCDLNNTGKANIVDAQIAYDFARGIYDNHESYEQLQRDADVNEDGWVNAADAFAIQRYALTGQLG